MKKNIALFIFLLTFLSCSKPTKINQKLIEKNINLTMDAWHKDVANSNFDAYFNTMTNDAIFIGTDASENWTKKQFMEFSKPYFDKKETWNFKPLERHIFISDDGKTAWFDELLDTWMHLCRGSGVLIKQNNGWKLKHYVLSVTVPNDSIKSVTKIKEKTDSAFIKTMVKNN